MKVQAHTDYRLQCQKFLVDRAEQEWELVKYVWNNHRASVDWPTKITNISVHKPAGWSDRMGDPRTIVEGMWVVVKAEDDSEDCGL